MKFSALCLTSLCLSLLGASCAGPQVTVVEAKPELMYALGTKRNGEVILRTSAPKQATRASGPHAAAQRLRLPDMEKLPSDHELNARKVSGSSSGVIVRPPAAE